MPATSHSVSNLLQMRAEVISSGNRKLKANVYIPKTYYPTGFIRISHYGSYCEEALCGCGAAVRSSTL